MDCHGLVIPESVLRKEPVNMEEALNVLNEEELLNCRFTKASIGILKTIMTRV